MPRHLPDGLTRVARFSIALSAILMLALPAARTASFAKNSKPIAKGQSFEELARQFAKVLRTGGVKRIAILDFEDPNSKVVPFGAWLADQFAAAPGNPWALMEVVDRKHTAEKWEQLRIVERNSIESDRLSQLAKALDATLVEGSYGAAENGLGLTLTTAYLGSGFPKSFVGKLDMTDEMKSHLTVPLDSLVPSDGMFVGGAGGISIPQCLSCPNPTFSKKELKGQSMGTVLLMVVIDPKGHASDARVSRGVNPELDNHALSTVKHWTFKPATDVDGKPVTTRTPIEVTFRVW